MYSSLRTHIPSTIHAYYIYTSVSMYACEEGQDTCIQTRTQVGSIIHTNRKMVTVFLCTYNTHTYIYTYIHIQVKVCTLIVTNWSTLWSQPQLKGRLLEPLQGIAMRVSQDGVTAELDFRCARTLFPAVFRRIWRVNTVM